MKIVKTVKDVKVVQAVKIVKIVQVVEIVETVQVVALVKNGGPKVLGFPGCPRIPGGTGIFDKYGADPVKPGNDAIGRFL